MWSVYVPATSAAPPPVGPTSPAPATALFSPLPSGRAVEAGIGSVSFLKDGRKIRVGDCALFQAGNAPPFIGIIRWFTTGKENCLRLCVNWLYRPADVKLPKGILLEAAPNEVFYSFHEDVIPAVSLLHPCKIAFLCKGVDLPSGVSSFVCRRVYDIANKRLWWLTDQDYIHERQEEVDQLLDKTRVAMHAAVQSDGQSPKPLNAPSTQQLKSGLDSVQNSGASFPSQTKVRKRERGEQGAEPIKRERPTKTEDEDHASYRLDNIMTEIAKITEKGALITTEGVEKLLRLMYLGNERKIDVTGRLSLADVIAATDKIECLRWFVQLKGLSILDDWLQGAHKGKAGDGSSPKESDKGSEELLLSLLRALDKLPVNLTALQTCNIGKSVNNLRSHKNLEIHKKARSLVDTWKKRVDAEMTKNNDVVSVGSNQAGTWPVKPGFPEAPNSGSRRGAEGTSRSAITQAWTCKSPGGKPGHSDATVKSTLTPGFVKSTPSLSSAAVSCKESLCRRAGSSGASDLPLVSVKEEKSSSSSHSQNNSQSCSSDHAKTMSSSWKEDARSSTAGSMNTSKTSGGSSRHRKSRPQKESNMDKSGSVNWSTALDKVSTQSALSCDKILDISSAHHGNGHRLIVRLPNPSRSPAQCSPARSAIGGLLEDPSITGSRVSSPGASDKFYQVDQKNKEKVDANGECWQNSDIKEGLVGSGEGDISRVAIRDEEHRTADEAGRVGDVSRAVCSSSGIKKCGSLIEPKTRNSFSSMNALIDSCVKYSESSAPLSAGDDIGMNLLASVAAGEMSKPGLVSPSGSPGNSPAKDEPSSGNTESKSRFSREDDVAQGCVQSDANADIDSAKQGKVAGPVSVSQELQETNIHFSVDCKSIAPLHDNKLTSQQVGQDSNPSLTSSKVAEIPLKVEVKCDNHVSASFLADAKEALTVNGICQLTEGKKKSIDCTHENNLEGCTKISEVICNSLGGGCDNGIAASGRKSEKSAVEESLACAPSDQVSSVPIISVKQQSVGNDVEALDGTGDAAATSSTNEPECFSKGGYDNQEAASAVSLGTSNKDDGVLERKEAVEHLPVGPDSHEEPASVPAREAADACAKPPGSGLSGADPDRRHELGTTAEASSIIITSQAHAGAKLDFDLNDGLPGDDFNQSELLASIAPVCSPAVRLPSRSPFVSDSLSTGSCAPITVAAPAKGPFVPPANLLKNKGEAGWKGSAATSAFRPAEPRKVLELPINASDVHSSDSTGKQGRPPLDIDLNVPDERVLEDVTSHSSPQTTGSESGVITNRDAPSRSGGGLDLDLNRVDEVSENRQLPATTSNRLDMSVSRVRPFSGGFLNGEANMFRNFDLNNGPLLDDSGVESASKNQCASNSNNVPYLHPTAGLRMGNVEIGNVSSWFSPGNSYPAVAIPPFMHDRREQPYPIVATASGAQRILGPVSGGTTFGGDVYRGPVLASSPAMAFSPASAFQYATFPFGAGFPLTSTSFPVGSTTYVDSSTGAGSCLPPIPSHQLVGAASGVTSHYPRPYAVNLSEGSMSTGYENSRKWGRQGLDLNSGPVSADIEVKDGRMPSTPRQHPLSISQAFVEEQARMFQMSGGGLKRKEREGGSWDERFYKHPS